jgi:hypothetical protein
MRREWILVLALAGCGDEGGPQPSRTLDPGSWDPPDPTPSPAGGGIDDDCADVTGHVKPGCPCHASLEGTYEACGTVYYEINDQQQCGDGVSLCEEGEWGACMVNNSTPDPDSN